MCLAMEKKYKEKEVTEAIEAMRILGVSDNDIKMASTVNSINDLQ